VVISTSEILEGEGQPWLLTFSAPPPLLPPTSHEGRLIAFRRNRWSDSVGTRDHFPPQRL